MRRGALLPAGLLLLAGVVGAPLRAPGAGQGPEDSGKDPRSVEVDRLFERWHRPDSPGAAVLVVHGGEVVHARGYGMANLEHGVPIRTNTVFDIASVSKQFGAMAIALLEAEGRLSLDDDVRDYIPDLPDFGRTITLRHLVHHTSGLRDWPGTLAMGGWDYQDVLSFQQILRMAYHQRDLNFDPGSEYAYSNTGYNLLAEVVSRVAGQSFREFCEARIFGPLGMTRTHFHDDHTEVVPDRADSYRPARDGGHRKVVSNLTALGSSSLFTTVEDLARWIANFQDPWVGGPDVASRMEERGVLSNGDTIGYAFGQQVGTFRGLRTVSHTGSWAGYRSILQRFPDHDFAVVILANTADMNPTALAREIAAIHLDDALAPEDAEPARPAPDEGGGGNIWVPTGDELREYVGVYASDELLTSYRIEIEEGMLVARHFRSGDRRMWPVIRDRFEAPGFGEVRFRRNADGRIEGFTANSPRIRGLAFTRAR